MQKKYQTLFVTCTAITAILSGCAESHTHQTSSVWEADFSNHWKVCSDCGQSVDESTHTPDDFGICTICGAQLVDWGESKSVYQFNENGDPLMLADYDADGTILTETRYTYEYDTDGNLLRSFAKTDGVLTEEYTYTVMDGMHTVSQYISYLEDGSKFAGDYDAYGNVIRSISYDAEGNVVVQTDSEYALSVDDQWYEAVLTTTEADGSKTVSELSEYGDQTSMTSYDADGNVLDTYTWEYTYNDAGNWQTIKYYCDHVLTTDTVYATVDTEDGSITYPETITEYEADGSKTVTVYDENDSVIQQTHYDADGNEIS